ncbi:MAG: hypothetical protein ACTHLJ_07380, partial [Angustibacter sp.]
HLAEQVDLGDQSRAALARVTRAVEQARYARPAAAPSPAPSALATASRPEGSGAGSGTGSGTAPTDVGHDVRVVVRAVAGSRSRGQRLRAALYPRSGAERTAGVARWFGRRFAAVDSALARWSHRVRLPRVHRHR